MPCAAATYNVTTSLTHTPTWNGSLVVTASNPPDNGTFTPEGSYTASQVTVHCGTNGSGDATIEFHNNHIHYKPARQVANNPPKFQGPVGDDLKPDDAADTWTAEAGTASK